MDEPVYPLEILKYCTEALALPRTEANSDIGRFNDYPRSRIDNI
jgi:hypothetical protein